MVSKEKEMTENQVARQKVRAATGHYANMNVCEACSAHVGAIYYSAPDCNETGWGVVLCEHCASAIELHAAAARR